MRLKVEGCKPAKKKEAIDDLDRKCDRCNMSLSDDGSCPYCDHGEEDFEEGCGKPSKKMKEAYDDSMYVDIEEVIGTLGRALEEGMDDPEVFSEVADIYGRLVEMRDAGYQLDAVQNESLTESDKDVDDIEQKFRDKFLELQEYRDSLSPEELDIQSKDPNSTLGILYKEIDKLIPEYQNSYVRKLSQSQFS